MSDSPVTDLVLRETPFDGPEAITLIAEVQQEYVTRYGGPDGTPVDPREFAPPQGLFVVAEVGGELAGCVGLRAHAAQGPEAVEMKRMYVRPAFRRRGLARRLLATAEQRASMLGYRRLILETGDQQPEAVALYGSAGYLPIAGFGIYANETGSLYFAKQLD
ncbi:GNAT family N-acetyltransferase [Kineosporia sp. J2-2]|uniref:GNAT family N-acetyltransferase n=1 Tax=Kineosporia corallincola TaxID=2835133 RepID=A0ABS5TAA6_9ACTN|nr:GNAT family N-acetyltransferase [Kineosporia corallincola]MBT0767798.1 GNAT family N-acetyltransferase [Kineosporia corallincola]